MRVCCLKMVYVLLSYINCRQIQRIGYIYLFYMTMFPVTCRRFRFLQSCIFSHPVANFNVLVLVKNMPRAISSFFCINQVRPCDLSN